LWGGATLSLADSQKILSVLNLAIESSIILKAGDRR
jgi:hypothetical protein